MRLIGWITALVAGAAVVTAEVAAQDAAARRGWTLGVGAGPARVDDLAGTPMVPSAAFERTLGRRSVFAARVGWIGGAGFYSLDALTLDLGLGIRAASARAEGSVVVGPTVILGGDSDGTPYFGGGPQVTLGGTLWLSDRIGLQAAGLGRLWIRSGATGFKPALTAGIAIRL